MIAPDHHGRRAFRQAPQQLHGNLNSWGPNQMLVVEQVPRHHYQCFMGWIGFDLFKELCKGRQVLLFSAPFGVADADMDIRDVKNVINGHVGS